LQDYDLQPGDHLEQRQVKTTLEHVIKESKKGQKGKILSSLDGVIPGTIEITDFTSCAAATAATRGLDGLGREQFIPKSQKWFLLSAAGSRSDGHMDTGGGHTVIETVTGNKLWIFKVPDTVSDQNGALEEAYERLASTRMFLTVEKRSQPMAGYRFEGLETEPGSLLCVNSLFARPSSSRVQIHETGHMACSDYDQLFAHQGLPLLELEKHVEHLARGTRMPAGW